jgi:hypothetical protein
MIKLALLLAIVMIGWRVALGEWPWTYLQNPKSAKPKTVRAKQIERARVLLGVSQSASPQEIRDAHREMATELHPDKGGSTARLAEINAARDILLADAPDNK